MTIGVGGSTPAAEIARLRELVRPVEPIGTAELQARVSRAQQLMKEQGVAALYLDTSANLAYFTGIDLKPTERLHGAILPAEGEITYVAPMFEVPKTRELVKFGTDIRGWEEHEDPAVLILDVLASRGIEAGSIALDPQTRFFTSSSLLRAGNRYDFINGSQVTAACRARKSAHEIALMQYANDVTLAVHRSAAAVLHEGMSSLELRGFATQAFQLFGAVMPGGLFLFGPATAYPHGVPYVQTLAEGDMVLVDISCELAGYRSDITRSYVFGEPSERQRFLWNTEHDAQQAAFDAARLGGPLEEIDHAARRVLSAAGFSADYETPGLPHRTGHGIGMEVHEEEYIVRGNKTPLAEGMCFTIEPTLCIYGECGVRLEDCVYATDTGPRWFTTPALSVDDPFGLAAG